MRAEIPCAFRIDFNSNVISRDGLVQEFNQFEKIIEFVGELYSSRQLKSEKGNFPLVNSNRCNDSFRCSHHFLADARDFVPRYTQVYHWPNSARDFDVADKYVRRINSEECDENKKSPGKIPEADENARLELLVDC